VGLAGPDNIKEAMVTIGIRREDKNEWERRVPLIPHDIAELIVGKGYDFVVQPSNIRAFGDNSFTEIGAEINEDLSEAKFVFAVKEIPEELFLKDTVYCFFSHVIKGQAYNMPMLRKIMDVGATLIDYECVTDELDRRLVFFGNYAGLAGMIDALWATGQRLRWEGVPNPFEKIKPAHEYDNLKEAKRSIARVAEEIEETGLPEQMVPFIIGYAGYGNVSRGAQEIMELFPEREILPEELADFDADPKHSKHLIYKVVFKEEDMVRPKNSGDEFELQDYYDYPEKYDGIFEEYLPHLEILANCIYWTDKYPRLLTTDYLRRAYDTYYRPRPRVIADISCDIEGAIECTTICTDSGAPVYVYNPFDGHVTMGVKGIGPVVLSIDNLPGQLPVDSSTYFSSQLKQFVPAIVEADFSVSFEELGLTPALKGAVIVYNGELTPDYLYLEQYIDK
jgi:alpha-aminoadipic semialdehyde synthase